jgi:hypothetical protein
MEPQQPQVEIQKQPTPEEAAERRKRCEKAWANIQEILKRERVKMTVSHLMFRPDGGVNPMIQIMAEE